MIFNQSSSQQIILIGKGVSKGVIRDLLWYNGRMDKLVNINDCNVGYELEVVNSNKQKEKQLKNKLVTMFGQYDNVIIKNTDIKI